MIPDDCWPSAGGGEKEKQLPLMLRLLVPLLRVLGLLPLRQLLLLLLWLRLLGLGLPL
ncbi:hypothetical protein DIPPA_08746 [Diplonema papillatum]|nr:hypothetical protein DIPPA_08746 [Diplonema papillatum]